ncbi:MAG: hypothetical protein J2P17_11590 [Mycobacterium sp.]|nr:hypothetical protein [Mycobacterium sp.]
MDSTTSTSGKPLGFAGWRHSRLDGSWSIIATDGYPYTPEEYAALMKEQVQERKRGHAIRITVDVREDTQQPAWRLHAREFGALTWVFDKKDIPDAARRIISRCGAAPKDFEVDLVFYEPFPVYEC